MVSLEIGVVSIRLLIPDPSESHHIFVIVIIVIVIIVIVLSFLFLPHRPVPSSDLTP